MGSKMLSLKKAILVVGVSCAGCTEAQFESTGDLAATGVTPTPGATPQATPTPEKIVETFTQSNAGNQIDILIVNDNSVSMGAEQLKLSQRFSSFIGSIADIDYHIGMTTTDLESPLYNQGGRLLTWEGTGSTVLTSTTPNAAQAFANTVQRKETNDCDGTLANCPASNEQPLLATIRAVEQRDTANAGFFRPDAPLIVVVLSDEDEMSSNPAGATTPDAVYQAVVSAFGVRKTLLFFGFIVRPDDAACLADQKAQAGGAGTSYYGTRISEMIHATGGNDVSICENDYSQPLVEMSYAMRRTVTTYFLKNAPTSGIEVIFTPQVGIGYRIEGNRLLLEAPPPVGTRIEVKYTQ